MAELAKFCTVCTLPIEHILRVNDETGEAEIIIKHMLDSIPRAERGAAKAKSLEAHTASYLGTNGQVKTVGIESRMRWSNDEAL